MRGGFAPSHVGVIEHIIMQKGGSVKQLNAGGQHINIVIPVSEQSGRKHGQQRAQAFPARLQYVVGYRLRRGRHGGDDLSERRVYAGLFKRYAGDQFGLGHDMLMLEVADTKWTLR
jgi:hypothetical protein